MFCFEWYCPRENMQQGYRELLTHLGVTAIILCDGGVDSVLLLDEQGVGTPAEDLLSLLVVSKAAAELELPVTLMCVGNTQLSSVYCVLCIGKHWWLIVWGCRVGVLGWALKTASRSGTSSRTGRC